MGCNVLLGKSPDNRVTRCNGQVAWEERLKVNLALGIANGDIMDHRPIGILFIRLDRSVCSLHHSRDLRHQRMSGVMETLDARNRQAIDGQWSYMDFLSRLLEDETERRAQKQLNLRLRRSTLNTTKTIEGFDFQFNPNLNRQQILQLAACEYIREHRNLLICGPTGVGKTHLAQALGQEAARQGLDVLFVSIQKMF